MKILIAGSHEMDEDRTLTGVDNEPEAIEASASNVGVRFGASAVEQISTYAGQAGGY